MKFATTAITYDLSDFELKPAKNQTSLSFEAQKATTPADIELVPLMLPDDLRGVLPANPKWVEAIVTGKPPEGKSYNSRSELVFAATIWMLSNKVEAGYVLSILLDPDMAISAHVLEQPNPLAYARRQVLKVQAIILSRTGHWPAVDQNGKPVESHPENIRRALAHLGVRAQRNTFVQSDEIEGQELSDRDLNDVAEILCSTFRRDLQFKASPASIRRELITIAYENRYHPVIEYLDGLVWDEVERVDRWLIDYAGAKDTELNRAFARKLLIAGVRRIKQPGVKFDNMLVLEGEQGAGKSRLAAKLAVRPEWFCDSLDLQSDDKTKAEILQRAWIVECQELDGMNKATSQKLKKFLSSPSDTYRKAYGRDAREYPRHCIIIGTTNEDTYLRDLTGNRRFWPVQNGDIDLNGFARIVDQLWAEAAVYEAEGESLILPPHLWAEASKAQERRMMEDPFKDILESTFADKKGRVSMETVKALLGLDTSRMTPYDSRRIKSIMAGIGWDYGSYRMFDLAGSERKNRKGFATGSGDETKTEYFWCRMPNGEYAISVLAEDDRESPF